MSDQLRSSGSHVLAALRRRPRLTVTACVAVEVAILWHFRWVAPVIMRTVYLFLDVHLAGGALTGH